MSTVTLEIPKKYKTLISTDKEIKKISKYFIDDYLKELYEDKILKEKLAKNEDFLELNNSLEQVLWK